MGWGRMMLLGNVGQQLDIQDLENAIREMQTTFEQTQNLDRSQERRALNNWSARTMNSSCIWRPL